MGLAAGIWGVTGVALLLLRAILRLSPVAADGLTSDLSGAGWGAAALWIGAMAYFEGYRGFQRGFSPRVVERARRLARDPRPLWTLVAPLYCMSLCAAERRRMIVSWSLLVTMIGLIVAVPHLGQPVRGVIDAGVVVGLVWGLAALLTRAFAAIRAERPRPAA